MLFSTCHDLQAVEEALEWGGAAREGQRRDSHLSPWQLSGLAKQQSARLTKL